MNIRFSAFFIFPVFLFIVSTGYAQNLPAADWLVNPVKQRARVYTANNNTQIILDNGLVRRVFSLENNVACISYENLGNGQQLLRAIKPEASVTINGKTYYVGGVYGQ